MSNSARIKTAQLGIPHGTAQNQLRKLIVFSLLQRLGEDVCFKCGQKIETALELSIEHKTPWLHGDIALFWDLNTIAFSHRKCSRPDRPRGTQPQAAPEGKAWCIGCRDFLDQAAFYKNKSTWNGLQKYCRACADRMNRASKQRRRAIATE